MNQWIFNASPLILLGKINRLDLITDLNPNFAVPLQVVEEIQSGPQNDPAIRWLKQPEIQTHILDTVSIEESIRQWDLGKGESSVLQACFQQPEYRVAVLDDLAARKCAQVYQVKLLGTIGILLKAKRANMICEIRVELEHLVKAGSNLSQKVLDAAINLANE